jgi:hypothetical protein
MCGCGKPTPIATYNSQKKQYIKGQPIRFIQGHNWGSPKGLNDVTHNADGTTTIKLIHKSGEMLDCIVDTADYAKVNHVRWYAAVRHRTTYASTSRGVLLHKLLAPRLVDHIDLNGLNNRQSNFRPATYSEQNAHMRKRRHGRGAQAGQAPTSQFKGVCWDKYRRKWEMQIHFQHKCERQMFDSELEAALAYDAAALRLQGEFALVNFPTVSELLAAKSALGQFKGVHLHKEGKWVAQVVGRHCRYLGLFVREEDAARAYDAAALEIFGEFACLNFPNAGEQGAVRSDSVLLPAEPKAVNLGDASAIAA